MGDLSDAGTGNSNVGTATALGDDFWAIATAQTSVSNQPSTATNLHAQESLLIQGGVAATGYVENSSLAAALVGLKFELATPGVITVDIIPGSKIEIDMAACEATVNRSALAIGKLKANETLEARALLNRCKAAVAELEQAAGGIKSGAFGAELAEQIRI
jgi:hypothetical protein